MTRASRARRDSAGLAAAALLCAIAACDLRSGSPPISRPMPEIVAGEWILSPRARATGTEVRGCAQSYRSSYHEYFPRIELTAARRGGEATSWDVPIASSAATGYSSEAIVGRAIDSTSIEHCASPDARTVVLRASGTITRDGVSGEWWLVQLFDDHAALVEARGRRAASCGEVLASAERPEAWLERGLREGELEACRIAGLRGSTDEERRCREEHARRSIAR